MRKTLILTATALVLAGLTATAVAGARGGCWSDGPPGFGPGGGMGAGMMGGGMMGDGMMRGGAMVLERLDGDGDGRVTRAEVEAFRADGFARFDADGDGTLSLDEFQPFWVELARPRMVDRFQALDDDGDGRVTTDEFDRPARGMFAWGDRDGDGALGPGDMRRNVPNGPGNGPRN